MLLYYHRSICFNTVTVSVQVFGIVPIRFVHNKFQYSDCVGSSGHSKKRPPKLPTFQYSDCVGSRKKLKQLKTLVLSFNTVTVSVQDKGQMQVPKVRMFQYSDCVGSRRRNSYANYIEHGFNTVTVSVQE